MRIRLLQSAVFRDRTSVDLVQPEIRVPASVDTQVVPDWITKDPYFELLEDDGKLEVVTSSVAKRIALANQPNVGLAGAEPTTGLTVDDLAVRENAFNKANADILAGKPDVVSKEPGADDSAAAAAKAVDDAKAKADADLAAKAKPTNGK